ncbi:hypothetical protein HOLleu_22966 [Holothuria leucospilota]|uniref:C-type lectin domain-containing protein n=1 Tax=Holothuria leucospilota TaxID=206669 RepID=A0A9Q1BU98_HOLLE|nr:hypothetical protein HOLleu_22966 [Holothuria leucospilota]
MASFRFKPFLFFVTLFGMYARIDSIECPHGWVEFETSLSRECFKIFDKETYDTAMTKCQTSESEFQPTLASISSEEEVFVRTIFKDYINRKLQQSSHPSYVPDRILLFGLTTENFEDVRFILADNSDFKPDELAGLRKQMAVALLNSPEGITETYALVPTSVKFPYVCKILI